MKGLTKSVARFASIGWMLALALGPVGCGGGGGGSTPPPPPVPPAVTAQPVDVVIVEAKSATFTVTASGSPVPQCQWERSGDSGATWVAVPGATALTYSLVAQDQDHGARFRAKLTNVAGSVTSQPATLTVQTLPSYSAQPEDATVLAGQGVAFSATVKGRPTPTLSWERSLDGGQTWTPAAGSTSEGWSFTAQESDNGMMSRLVATNVVGRSESRAARLTVNFAPRFLSHPAFGVVTRGQAATFIVGVQGQPLPALQWQRSLDGGATWSDLVGRTSSTLSLDTRDLAQPIQVRAIALNTVASASSSAATLAILAPQRLSAGTDHAAVLRPDGTIWTWGQHNLNASGSWGEVEGSPIQVPGLGDPVSVACGNRRTRVVMRDGTLWGWGGGERGSGFAPSSTQPVRLFDLDRVAKVATGFFHALALRMDGTVWTWGMNEAGQLGDGTTTIRLSPVVVPGLANIVDVAAAGQYSMALDASGSVWVWGQGGVSRTDGSGPDPKVPYKLAGITGIRRIGCGYGVAMAMNGAGEVWGWGANGSGQLGDMSVPGFEDPTRLAWLDGLSSFSLGGGHTLLLDPSGLVRALGSNTAGQLGDGTLTVRAIPVPVSGLTQASEVAAGQSFSVALATDGSLWAWGSNWAEELGDGGAAVQRQPKAIPGLGGMQQLSVGLVHAMALDANGTVWSWGTNLWGQLGDGSTVERTAPAAVPGLSDVVAIAAGGSHSLALKSDGTLWGWGSNGTGQLGRPAEGAPQLSPAQVAGLTDVMAVEAGNSHTLALKHDGTVWSWGANTYGSLGNGTDQASGVPAAIPGLTGITRIWVKGDASFALEASGKLWAWGSNWQGQLGDGTQTDRWVPTRVVGVPSVSALAVGWGFAMALDADGALWSWGDNGIGQLGDGTLSSLRPTPAKVLGFPAVTAIAACDQAGFAIKADGTLLSWGNNYSGDLGDGTYAPHALPTPIGGLSGTLRVSATRSTVLATTGSATYAWGSDGYGGLGFGRKLRSTAPVRVSGF